MSDLPPRRLVGRSASISACFVVGVNGLRVYLLEADHEEPSQPYLMLLPSLPELPFP